MRVLILLAGCLLLPGCIAKTAVDIATMPVKAGAKAADWATTSQSEADRNYGRKMRKQEEREARERRDAERKASKGEAQPPQDD